MKIKKGDTVLVIGGKNRGKTGKVVSVDSVKRTLKIAGVNIMKRHLKARRNQPVRIGYKISAANTKERICKICKSTI